MVRADQYFDQIVMSLRNEGLPEATAVRIASAVRQAAAEHGLQPGAQDTLPLQGALGDLIENLRVDVIQVVEQAREEMRAEADRMASRQKSILVYNMLILAIIAAFIAVLASLDSGTGLKDAARKLQQQAPILAGDGLA